MTNPPSPRPLSITIIALAHLVWAVWFAVVATARRWDYGNNIQIAIDLFLFVICVFLAVGLWRMRRSALWVAIAFTTALLLRTIFIMGTWLTPKEWHVTWMTHVWGVVSDEIRFIMLFGVELWFLIKRKAAFEKSTTTQQT